MAGTEPFGGPGEVPRSNPIAGMEDSWNEAIAGSATRPASGKGATGLRMDPTPAIRNPSDLMSFAT
jgi:hypothetical protein